MKKMMTMMLMAGLALGAASCDDDDNDIKVPESFEKALLAKYPNAKRVEWEQKGAYKVADFMDAGMDLDVWFDRDARWVMTETDYTPAQYGMVPAAVMDAFKASGYSTWTVDDISMYERADATFYVYDLEKKGETDMDMYILPTGEITKVAAEADVYPDTPLK